MVTAAATGLIFARAIPSTSEVKPVYLNPKMPIDVRVDDLLSRMTIEEKIGQMNIPCAYKKRIGWGMNVGEISLHTKLSPEIREKQKEGARKYAGGTWDDSIGPGGGFFTLSDRLIYEGTLKQAEFLNELQKIAVEETRLKIPLLQIEEGTHGLMCSGATIFPEGLSIGSTWNMDLVEDIYATAAREGRSIGVHALCTLVIEPNRDPRLGRNEEGYGECPFLCSRIAESIVQGIQGNDVSANDKLVAALSHYPGQSEPSGGLERGAMHVSERKLREVFLPPWEAGVRDAGALCLMATYPAINGIAVHNSSWILTKLLREELGFGGVVLSEGRGISTLIDERVVSTQKEAGQLAVKAGIDVVIPGVESGNDYELKLYGKKATLDDNCRTIMILKELGVFYVLPGFIMFGPNSTMETIRSNIGFLYKFGYSHNLTAIKNTLMLLRDSKLYRILREEGRVIESEKYWELPKYIMKDPSAKRMGQHWQNVLAQFPNTSQVSSLQINIGNLISRMSNPRNAKVLSSLKDEYFEFKNRYEQLSVEFGKLQYDYFVYTMRLIESNCLNEELSSSANDFFINICGDYLPLYDELYSHFLDKIVGAGFGLSGLIFKHFTSAMVIKGVER